MKNATNLAENLNFPEDWHLYGDFSPDDETTPNPHTGTCLSLDETREVLLIPHHSTLANTYISMSSDESEQVAFGAMDTSQDLGSIPLNEISNARVFCHLEGSFGFTSNSKYEIDTGILSHEIERQLEQLFTDARDELFEVGIESQFSKGLQKLCTYDPTTVFQYIRTRLIVNDTNSEAFAEILRWASHQDARAIRDHVADLLSVGLLNSSSLVRDAAALSLAYLEKTAAVAQLQQALEREKVPELQKDLEDLIRSLEI